MICVRRSTQYSRSLLFRYKIRYEMTTNFDFYMTKTSLSFSSIIATGSTQNMRLVCSEKTRRCHLDRCHHRSSGSTMQSVNPATRPENLQHRLPSSDERLERVDCRRSLYR